MIQCHHSNHIWSMNLSQTYKDLGYILENFTHYSYAQTKTQVDWYLESKRQRLKCFLELPVNDIQRRQDHCLFNSLTQDIEVINKIQKCNETYNAEFSPSLYTKIAKAVYYYIKEDKAANEINYTESAFFNELEQKRSEIFNCDSSIEDNLLYSNFPIDKEIIKKLSEGDGRGRKYWPYVKQLIACLRNRYQHSFIDILDNSKFIHEFGLSNCKINYSGDRTLILEILLQNYINGIIPKLIPQICSIRTSDKFCDSNFAGFGSEGNNNNAWEKTAANDSKAVRAIVEPVFIADNFDTWFGDLKTTPTEGAIATKQQPKSSYSRSKETAFTTTTPTEFNSVRGIMG